MSFLCKWIHDLYTRFLPLHCNILLIHSCWGIIMFLIDALPVQYDFYVQKHFGSVLQIGGTNWLTCIHLPNAEVAFPNTCPLELLLPLGWDLIAAAGTTVDLQNVIIFFSGVHHLLTFIWFPSGTHCSNKCYLLVQFCQDHKPGNQSCNCDSHQINHPLNCAVAAQVQGAFCLALVCQAQKLEWLN